MNQFDFNPYFLPHYRWVIVSLASVHASTSQLSLAQAHTMVSTGEGAEVGKVLLIVRTSDGMTVEAYAGSRASVNKVLWTAIPVVVET